MDTPPPITAFPHQAAKLSWACPLIMVVVITLGKQAGSPLILDLVALLLILMGFAFGLIALLGISKYGARGILGHALAGLIINGFLIFIFITNFMAARAKAQQHAGSRTIPAAAIAKAVI